MLPVLSQLLSPQRDKLLSHCTYTHTHTKTTLNEECDAASEKCWSPDFLQASEASLVEKWQSQAHGEKYGAGRLLEIAGAGDTGFLVDFLVQGHQLYLSLFGCLADLSKIQRQHCKITNFF